VLPSVNVVDLDAARSKARANDCRPCDVVRLRGLLSNLGAPLENALRELSDITKYIKSDPMVLAPEVRSALQRDNHRLEPAEVDQLMQAYETGANLSELGRQFKVHPTTARRHLLERGIPLRSAEPNEQIRDLGCPV
jgi:hypothetical protein